MQQAKLNSVQDGIWSANRNVAQSVDPTDGCYTVLDNPWNFDKRFDLDSDIT